MGALRSGRRSGVADDRHRGPRLVPRRDQRLYDEKGEDGRRRYPVAQIAAEFGVARPTIYRHLQTAADPPAR